MVTNLGDLREVEGGTHAGLPLAAKVGLPSSAPAPTPGRLRPRPLPASCEAASPPLPCLALQLRPVPSGPPGPPPASGGQPRPGRAACVPRPAPPLHPAAGGCWGEAGRGAFRHGRARLPLHAGDIDVQTPAPALAWSPDPVPLFLSTPHLIPPLRCSAPAHPLAEGLAHCRQ